LHTEQPKRRDISMRCVALPSYLPACPVQAVIRWLSAITLVRVQGLEAQEQLTTLCLNQNMVMEIGEGLRPLCNLRNLDLSNNQLETLAGLQHLPQLHTLTLAHNRYVRQCCISTNTSAQSVPCPLHCISATSTAIDHLYLVRVVVIASVE